MFNIKDFTSSINNKGVLKNNKYIATITFGGNHYLNDQVGKEDTRLFSLRCDSVQLPGLAIASADGPPRLGYGPVEKHPYNVNFEDISLTFIVDSNSRMHRMLHKWVSSIVNFRSKGGQSLRGTSGPMKSSAYEVGYRNRYAAQMQIDIYRDTGSNGNHEKTMTYTIYNAFPMAFPSSAMNWQDGEILKINIPFAYTDYTVAYRDYDDQGRETELPQETGRVDATTRAAGREIAGALGALGRSFGGTTTG